MTMMTFDGVDEHDEDTDENEGKKTKKTWVRQVASTGSPPVFWWCDSLSSITGLCEMTHGISSVRSWNYIFLSLYALSQLKFHRLKIYSIQQAQHQKKQYNRFNSTSAVHTMCLQKFENVSVLPDC